MVMIFNMNRANYIFKISLHIPYLTVSLSVEDLLFVYTYNSASNRVRWTLESARMWSDLVLPVYMTDDVIRWAIEPFVMELKMIYV